MEKRKFILAITPIIISIIILVSIVLLIYALTIPQTDKISVLIRILGMFIFGLSWVYFVFTNSFVKITDKELIMPRKYSMDKYFLSGFTFLNAIFKKKMPIKIKDIQSIDFIVGYNGPLLDIITMEGGGFSNMSNNHLSSLHQPMTIKMKDGTIHKFFIKFYSKRGFIWILRNLNKINPKINFSQSCKELIELKSPFQMTKTEKEDAERKKKLILGFITFLIILVMLIIAITLIFN